MTKRKLNFLGIECSYMPPTKTHRAAIWECMLGTVFAMNDENEIYYFDYDYSKAKKFAGVSHKRDMRVWKNSTKYSKVDYPKEKQLTLWIKRGAKK